MAPHSEPGDPPEGQYPRHFDADPPPARSSQEGEADIDQRRNQQGIGPGAALTPWAEASEKERYRGTGDETEGKDQILLTISMSIACRPSAFSDGASSNSKM